MSKVGGALAALTIEPAGDREVKLGFVRKLMLALKKDDEHAALDALEDLYRECESTEEPADDDEDD